MASKILLGAHYKGDVMNPMEYCTKAAGVEFKVLKPKHPEYAIIEQYASNTYID